MPFFITISGIPQALSTITIFKLEKRGWMLKKFTLVILHCMFAISTYAAKMLLQVSHWIQDWYFSTSHKRFSSLWASAIKFHSFISIFISSHSLHRKALQPWTAKEMGTGAWTSCVCKGPAPTCQPTAHRNISVSNGLLHFPTLGTWKCPEWCRAGVLWWQRWACLTAKLRSELAPEMIPYSRERCGENKCVWHRWWHQFISFVLTKHFSSFMIMLVKFSLYCNNTCE